MLFTNRHMTTGFIVTTAILFSFPTLEIQGQDPVTEATTPVQYATAVAAMTGRPIFAVAGQST